MRGKGLFGCGDTPRRSSDLARAPPVQHPTIPFRRPPGTAITGRHRNRGSRRRRGRSIEVAGHGIGRTDPLLDHPHHLDDPRRVSYPGTHLVTGRHHRRWLCRPIVDPDTPTSARRSGVRPGLRQPNRPQPPIHAGRLHNIHHGLPTGVGTLSTVASMSGRKLVNANDWRAHVPKSRFSRRFTATKGGSGNLGGAECDRLRNCRKVRA